MHTAAGSNPIIDQGGCSYVPDASNPQIFPCSPNYQSVRFGYVGAPIELALNVSSPTGSSLTVTIWWEAFVRHDVSPFVPGLANASAVQSFDLTPPGAGVPVHLVTNWTYESLSNHTIVGGKSSYYLVYVNVTSASGYDAFSMNGCNLLPYGNCFLQIAVAVNSAPQLMGVNSAYTYVLPPPDPVIPEFSIDASVQDLDNDPVVVTWNWDDGNVTVNRTGPAGEWTWVNVSHTYSFPLDISPRNIYYHLNVSIDDGIPTHNVSLETLIYFYIGPDMMPRNLTFISPSLGSIWLTNVSVPIESHMEEPEGEPMIYFWDFGDGNVSPQGALPQNGSASTAHAYTEPGNYSLTLWATDGIDKELCLNLTANCTTTISHWASSSVVVRVILNRPPRISLTIASNPGVARRDAVFAVALRDLDGDNLTVTWSFGDKTWAVNRSSAPNYEDVIQVHNYTRWGDPPSYTFQVVVWVDDGWGHNVTNATEIFVGSENMPPLVSAELLLANNTVRANDTFWLRVNVSDPEGDSVWINVDWGDGNVTTGTNDTMQPGANYTLAVSHSYWSIGNYTINVTATDHMVWVRKDAATGDLITLPHEVQVGAVVDVEAALPPPVSQEWTWVDYVTLGAVLAIPVAAAVRAGYRRHLERKED